jgi:uncharacterized protein (DUF2141 family)
MLIATPQKGARKMNRFKTIIAAVALNIPAIAAVAASPATAPAAAPAAAKAPGLEITFADTVAQKGVIMLGLYNSEQGYNTDKPLRGAGIPVTHASVSTVFAGLPDGRYAVKAYHDVDGDGKMSTNPYGMPIEPFAFSNNAKGNMGPASWADAAFEVKGGVVKHVISFK